jgi:hypothetical protein
MSDGRIGGADQLDAIVVGAGFVLGNQLVTESVLNRRSQELWRQSAGETVFRVVSAGVQCGGFA